MDRSGEHRISSLTLVLVLHTCSAQCVIPRRSHLALSLSFLLNILSFPPPIALTHSLTPICPLPMPAMHVSPRSSIEDLLKRSQLPFSLFNHAEADIFPLSSEWPRTPSSNHIQKLGGGRLLNSSPPLGKKTLSCLHLKERVKYLQSVQRRPNVWRWEERDYGS